ncbi:MAG TPA: hypothetical protein VIJ93_07755 [bacterium]
MNEQIELIKLVAARLEKAGIPYMLTGSAALDFYAQPRMTRDIDLVVELNPSDAKNIQEAFSPGFYLDETAVKIAVQHRGMFNAIHQAWMIKVDFIVRKDSEYRKVEFNRRQSMKLQDGSTVFVASPEDLILSKLDWSKETRSEVQKRDIQSLLSLTLGLDYNYLKKWALALGVSKQLEELKP